MSRVLFCTLLIERSHRRQLTLKVASSHLMGSRDGAMIGSIPGLGVICGLSLLLVLVLAPRGFSPGTPVFPFPEKPTFPNSNSIWIIVKHFIMSLWLGKLLTLKKLHFYLASRDEPFTWQKIARLEGRPGKAGYPV